jgi:hypothetical protein
MQLETPKETLAGCAEIPLPGHLIVHLCLPLVCFAPPWVLSRAACAARKARAKRRNNEVEVAIVRLESAVVAKTINENFYV